MLKLTDEEKFKLGMRAAKLVEEHKGILAADESPNSLEKRFKTVDIENTEENRKLFREYLFKTPNINRKISGVILHEESFSMKDSSGQKLTDILKEKNIAFGIKLDTGLKDFNDNEKVTKGLDDLNERIKNPLFAEAEFAKWRSVFTISNDTPTKECVNENCAILADYAEICQKNGIVPILEPEILWDGNYTNEKAESVYKTVLSTLLLKINQKNLFLPGLLIKTGYTTHGKHSKLEICPRESAKLTYHVLASTIPPAIPGVVFLSGGHSSEESFSLLSEVNKEKSKNYWALTFSYGRALTDPFLSVWKGKEENVEKAQETFLKQVDKCFSAVKSANK